MAVDKGISPQREKLETLQAGRGIAALSVMLFHANIIYAREITNGAEPFRFLVAGASGVEFFFVLSGFIMMLVHQRDLGVLARAKRYGLARLVRIYPAFWIVFTLFLAGKLAMGQHEAALATPLDYVWAYLLLPFDGGSPLAAAWTLSHELLFYGLFGLAILSRTLGFALLGLWTAACLCVWVLTHMGLMTVHYPVSFLLAEYNMLFAFGIVSALVFRGIGLQMAAGLLVLGCAVFALTARAHIVDDLPGLAPFYGLAAALVITALVRLETAERFAVPGFLVKLGDASYSVYLIHGPVMVVGAMILRKMSIAAHAGPATVIALLCLGGLAAGLVFHLIAERPLLRLMSRRITGRSREAIPVAARN